MRSLVSALVLVLLPTVALAAPPKQLFSDRAQAIIAGAARVEVYRVDPKKPKLAKPQLLLVGYPRVGKAVALAPDSAARLSLLFFDEQLYDLKILKRCAPGAVAVAFNFVRDGESAEIILEFNCAKIFVVVRDATGKHVETTGAHFDPGMAKLVALAKESLPKDKKVQKLKESR